MSIVYAGYEDCLRYFFALITELRKYENNILDTFNNCIFFPFFKAQHGTWCSTLLLTTVLLFKKNWFKIFSISRRKLILKKPISFSHHCSQVNLIKEDWQLIGSTLNPAKIIKYLGLTILLSI